MKDETDEQSILWVRPQTHAVLAVSFTAIGVGVAMGLGPEEWSTAKSILAGLFGGFGTYFILFANRMLLA